MCSRPPNSTGTRARSRVPAASAEARGGARAGSPPVRPASPRPHRPGLAPLPPSDGSLTHAHRSQARPRREGRHQSTRSSSTAGPGPPASPPPSRDARPRRAHWTAAGGGGEARGRRPPHTLTWLLVVVAYHNEVVGQPGHDRRRRAREAGSRRRPRRRRRPPGPGELSIFPSAAVAVAAALQPCLTTEALTAPAPRLAPAPPPPHPKGLDDPVPGVREPTRRPEAARTRGSRGGRPGAAWPRAATEAGRLEAQLLPQRPPPPPGSLFSWSRGPSFRHLPFAVGGKRGWRGAGSLGKFVLWCCLLPPAARMKFSRPRLEAWNLHRQGFLLHVSCLCCADGNFRNMPPSRRGRKRLAQSSEAPLVSGLPGLGAVSLGFPLSAPGSYST